MSKILVTGSAGFIGFHLVERLIRESIQTSKEEEKWDIVGLDNINDYYDVNLKYARLKESGICKEQIEYNKVVTSTKYEKYRFIKLNLEEKENILKLFEKENFDYVVNFAAQAGVRYSLENPYACIDSNIYGFLNILEGCRHYLVKHFLFASSSSVYGNNSKIPFSEDNRTDTPISLYAATKKSNELMAHTYSKLYGIKTTGMRFFTVYGPWGRPDMAYFSFTEAIYNNKEIKIFNNGKLERDFTYIDDIIEGVYCILEKGNFERNNYKLYNIGNNKPVKLIEFIETLENVIGKKSIKKYLQMQPGDVYKTFADIDNIINDYGFRPKYDLLQGLNDFNNWYKTIYQ